MVKGGVFPEGERRIPIRDNPIRHSSINIFDDENMHHAHEAMRRLKADITENLLAAPGW